MQLYAFTLLDTRGLRASDAEGSHLSKVFRLLKPGARQKWSCSTLSCVFRYVTSFDDRRFIQ